MITGFAPIADEDSCVLILGSMPSEASLAKGEYYGHPRNAFWPLISALLGEPLRSSYAARVDMLLRHGIALWDVVASCEREGSGDAAIRHVVVNDFPAFYAAHPNIRYVFFNGRKAWELYKKHVGLNEDRYVYEQLGSTSPAHAVPFEERLRDWQRMIKRLREES
jgi:TDG/mug DNA glycosylase family protein